MINFMSFYVYNKKENMIKEFINYILDIAKYHKAINYVGYKRNININDGHNTKYYQFIIEDECFLEKQLIEGILTLRLDIDVMGFVTSDVTVLDVQDNALHILLDVIEFINNGDMVEVRDYSFISFSEYTDDKASGVRASVQFIIPSPINICEYKDNFIEKEEEVTVDIDITPSNECSNTSFITDENKLILNPIKLK